MKNNIFIVLLVLIFCSSCKQDLAKVVTAVTGSILEPVSMTITPNENLGEIVVGDEPITLTVEVKNNSSDKIRKITLDIDKSQSVVKFKENDEGFSNSPGLGGTCTDTLLSGNKCIFKIAFNPRKSGVFSIPVTLNYENLIEPQEKSVVITALTGEPASLVFTNDTSNYDLGVIEQTEPVKRYLNFEIANKGGLTAKNVTTTIINSDASNAFKIEKNTCDKNLIPNQICNMQISYEPHNNNYSDPEIEYKSQLTLSYIRDPKGTNSSLNGYANFVSAAIEGKFKENFKIIDYGMSITGNKTVKSVRVTNVGYREGILKEMIFTDYQGNFITTCKKAATGNLLDCQKDLKDFPYIVQDSNSCFERLVQGVVGKTPGENCFFNITYWPSLTWESGTQSTHYFNEAKISLKYDSQWKGSLNIVTKSEMFELFADFISAGKLALYEVLLGNTVVDTSDIVNHVNSADIDLGRLALVSSDIYTTFIKMTWKNTGENVATLQEIADKHSPVTNKISELGYDINSYYKQIKSSSGCGFIPPGGTCNISFNLAPVPKGSQPAEDALMYDDFSNPLKKLKYFTIKYDDGSKFEDNGDNSTVRTFTNNVTSKLIKKGSLAFTSPLSIIVPNLVNGNSTTQNFCLTNVGTGDIYAIKAHASENFLPKGQSQWPYKPIDLGSIPSGVCPSPAAKDCYDIIYAATDNLPMMPDPSKILQAGQTCVLSVDVRVAETLRVKDNTYTTTNQHTRPFSPILSNTTNAWDRTSVVGTATPISYTYYDGDYVDTDPKSFLNYGYVGASGKTNVTANFQSQANLILINPLPITSAVFHRPSVIYPAMSATYPTNMTLTGYTTPEAYFNYSYFYPPSHGFTKSDDATTHVKALNLTGNPYNTEYKIHIGTFPVGETNTASFTFSNEGSTKATNIVFSETSNPTSPITIKSFNGLTSKPYPALSLSRGQITTAVVNFAPTSPGLFKRCFNANYNNGLEYVDQYICVYGEAVSFFPKLLVQTKDVDVTMPGPTEALGSTFTTLSAPTNHYNNSNMTFSAIRSSAVYAKKIIRVTNVGNTSAKKLNLYYMASETDASVAKPIEITMSPTSTKGCAISTTLAAGDYCEIYVQYQPGKSSLATLTRWLGMVYEITPDSSQYIYQSVGMIFTSLDPAKLAMALTTSESVIDWSAPTTPLPLDESWPLDLKSYNRSTNPHLVLNGYPEVKTFPVVTISNLSTLKASFLYMNPTPAAGTWNMILSNTFATVHANRACFYGDDEFNATIPASEKGFNSASVNPCQLSVQFTGYQTYTSCSAWNATVKTKTVRVGQQIDNSCNPYVIKLNYYNNKRASSEVFNIHVKGFIEPNRSTTLPVPAVFANVSANFTSGSLGKVSFSWPNITSANANWGSISKYRIYYDVSPDNLNGVNVFKTTGGPSFVDTTNTSTTNITITNLTVGRYYFFKVMTVRTYAGIQYIADSNLPLLTLPIPAADHIYHHPTKTLVDKAYLAGTGDRPKGVTSCAAAFYNLSIKGVIVKDNKELIKTPVWNYLNTNPALSSGYPGDGIGSLPHWLGDTAYDLKTNISLYDGSVLAGYPNYNPASMSGNMPAYKLVYQKVCNNNVSCDNLYKIVGGDDVDLYFQGVFYAKDTAVTAYYRCSAVLKCPTATTKTITDPSCALP